MQASSKTTVSVTVKSKKSTAAANQEASGQVITSIEKLLSPEQRKRL